MSAMHECRNGRRVQSTSYYARIEGVDLAYLELLDCQRNNSVMHKFSLLQIPLTLTLREGVR